MTQVSHLEVLLSANATSLTSGLGQADSMLANFASNAGAKLGAIGVGITALTAPLTAFVVQGVGVAAEFEASMTEVSARTGIVGADLQSISDFALQMGADTSFSGQQAADAMLQLLTSGQNAEQAMATLPDVLDLAAASGGDLGATADSLTDIMSAYGLNVEDAADVTDTLAQASGASSATLEGLAQGFGNVGGVANSFGLDVETTAAALAVLSENGTKGAEAGTALKSVLTNMVSDRAQNAMDDLGVSMYDAQGNARDFEVVLTDLDTALDDLPAEEQNSIMLDLAGSYGIVALNAFRGSISIGEMEASMEDAAGASEVAEARMDTFRGRVDTLRGSIETLQIHAFTPLIQNSLSPMIEKLTDGINAVTDFATANPVLTQTIMDMGIAAVVAGPMLLALGGFVAALASPVVLATLAIAGIAGAISAWQRDLGGIRSAFQELNLAEITQGISQALGTIEIGDTTISDIATQLRSGIQAAIASLGNLTIDTTAFTAAIDQIETGLTTAFEQFELPDVDFSGFTTDVETAISGAITSVESTSIDLTPITTAINGAVTTLDTSAIDLSPISDAITNFAGITIDTAAVDLWADENLNAVLDVVVAVAGIVFGGPVGMAIGAAKLVATAINTDFLGISTFLDTSGIRTAVETAFNDIKTFIDELMASIFGGGGGGLETGPANFDMAGMIAPAGQVDTSGLSKIASDIQLAIRGISAVVGSIAKDVGPGLEDFAAGVKGFIDALMGSETEGLYDVARPIIGTIGALIGAVAGGVGFTLGLTLSAIGNALTPFGEAISSFITMLSNLGQGDLEGAFGSFVDIFANLGSAILSFPVTIVDGVIEKINDLFGLEIPNVGEIVNMGREAIEDALFGIQQFLDGVRLSITLWMSDIQLRWLSFVGDMRKNVLNASAGAIDIYPNFVVESDEIRKNIALITASDDIAAMLRDQIGVGEIDLNEMVTFTMTDASGMATILSGPLSEALNNPIVISAMGSAGQLAVEEALRIAMTVGDQQTIEMLKPVAVDMGIDLAGLEADVKAQVAEGDYNTTVSAQITVDAIINFAQNIGTQIQNAVNNSGLGGIIDNVVDAFTPEIGPPPPPTGGGDAGGQDWQMPFGGGGGRSASGGGRSSAPSSSGDAPILVVNAYGRNPRELGDMIESILKEKGYGPTRRQGAF